MVSCKLVLAILLVAAPSSVMSQAVGTTCTAAAFCSTGLACNDKPTIDKTGTKVCTKQCTVDTECGGGTCGPSTLDTPLKTCDLSGEAVDGCAGPCGAGTVCNEFTLQCDAPTTLASTASVTEATTVGTCLDIAPNCAALSAQGLCTDAKYQALMSSDCANTAATCSFCGEPGAGSGAAGGGIGTPQVIYPGTSTTTCVDLITSGANSCTALASYCNVSAWISVMTTNCPATCNRCINITNTSGVCADTYKANGTTDCVASKKHLCTNATYQTIYRQQCPKLCGFCI
uniref:ShKT domain-containing protein n=1 Tax=Rhabditophanes sp. KR3021 TaxID=114890 RepID=A0AC35UC80_9BILA